MEDKEENGGGFFWFLAGLGLGAAIAMLYAPRPGREVRGFISESAGNARDFLTRRGPEVYDKGQELIEEAATMVTGVASGAAAASEGTEHSSRAGRRAGRRRKHAQA